MRECKHFSEKARTFDFSVHSSQSCLGLGAGSSGTTLGSGSGSVVGLWTGGGNSEGCLGRRNCQSSDSGRGFGSVFLGGGIGSTNTTRGASGRSGGFTVNPISVNSRSM